MSRFWYLIKYMNRFFYVNTYTLNYFLVEPESDFLSWKATMTEAKLGAEIVMQKFLDKCAAYEVKNYYNED